MPLGGDGGAGACVGDVGGEAVDDGVLVAELKQVVAREPRLPPHPADARGGSKQPAPGSGEAHAGEVDAERGGAAPWGHPAA